MGILANRIRAKHKDAYKDWTDEELEVAWLEKYPNSVEYKEQADPASRIRANNLLAERAKEVKTDATAASPTPAAAKAESGGMLGALGSMLDSPLLTADPMVRAAREFPKAFDAAVATPVRAYQGSEANQQMVRNIDTLVTGRQDPTGRLAAQRAADESSLPMIENDTEAQRRRSALDRAKAEVMTTVPGQASFAGTQFMGQASGVEALSDDNPMVQARAQAILAQEKAARDQATEQERIAVGKIYTAIEARQDLNKQQKDALKETELRKRQTFYQGKDIADALSEGRRKTAQVFDSTNDPKAAIEAGRQHTLLLINNLRQAARARELQGVADANSAVYDQFIKTLTDPKEFSRVALTTGIPMALAYATGAAQLGLGTRLAIQFYGSAASNAAIQALYDGKVDLQDVILESAGELVEIPGMDALRAAGAGGRAGKGLVSQAANAIKKQAVIAATEIPGETLQEQLTKTARGEGMLTGPEAIQIGALAGMMGPVGGTALELAGDFGQSAGQYRRDLAAATEAAKRYREDMSVGQGLSEAFPNLAPPGGYQVLPESAEIQLQLQARRNVMQSGTEATADAVKAEAERLRSEMFEALSQIGKEAESMVDGLGREAETENKPVATQGKTDEERGITVNEKGIRQRKVGPFVIDERGNVTAWGGVPMPGLAELAGGMIGAATFGNLGIPAGAWVGRVVFGRTGRHIQQKIGQMATRANKPVGAQGKGDPAVDPAVERGRRELFGPGPLDESEVNQALSDFSAGFPDSTAAQMPDESARTRSARQALAQPLDESEVNQALSDLAAGQREGAAPPPVPVDPTVRRAQGALAQPLDESEINRLLAQLTPTEQPGATPQEDPVIRRARLAINEPLDESEINQLLSNLMTNVDTAAQPAAAPVETTQGTVQAQEPLDRNNPMVAALLNAGLSEADVRARMANIDEAAAMRRQRAADQESRRAAANEDLTVRKAEDELAATFAAMEREQRGETAPPTTPTAPTTPTTPTKTEPVVDEKKEDKPTKPSRGKALADKLGVTPDEMVAHPEFTKTMSELAQGTLKSSDGTVLDPAKDQARARAIGYTRAAKAIAQERAAKKAEEDAAARETMKGLPAAEQADQLADLTNSLLDRYKNNVGAVRAMLVTTGASKEGIDLAIKRAQDARKGSTLDTMKEEAAKNLKKKDEDTAAAIAKAEEEKGIVWGEPLAPPNVTEEIQENLAAEKDMPQREKAPKGSAISSVVVEKDPEGGYRAIALDDQGRVVQERLFDKKAGAIAAKKEWTKRAAQKAPEAAQEAPGATQEPLKPAGATEAAAQPQAVRQRTPEDTAKIKALLAEGKTDEAGKLARETTSTPLDRKDQRGRRVGDWDGTSLVTNIDEDGTASVLRPPSKGGGFLRQQARKLVDLAKTLSKPEAKKLDLAPAGFAVIQLGYGTDITGTETVRAYESGVDSLLITEVPKKRRLTLTHAPTGLKFGVDGPRSQQTVDALKKLAEKVRDIVGADILSQKEFGKSGGLAQDKRKAIRDAANEALTAIRAKDPNAPKRPSKPRKGSFKAWLQERVERTQAEAKDLEMKTGEDIAKLREQDPVGYALYSATNYLFDNMNRVAHGTDVGREFGPRTDLSDMYKGGLVLVPQPPDSWVGARKPVWKGFAGELYISRTTSLLSAVMDAVDAHHSVLDGRLAREARKERVRSILEQIAAGDRDAINKVIDYFKKGLQNTLAHEILHGLKDTRDTGVSNQNEMQRRMNQSALELLDTKTQEGTTLREEISQYFDSRAMEEYWIAELIDRAKDELSGESAKPPMHRRALKKVLSEESKLPDEAFIEGKGADELGFYSHAERVVSDPKAPKKLSAEQWLGYLKNPQRGVKAEELRWTGLEDYLNEPVNKNRQIPKEEIVRWLRNNKVEIVEYGANPVKLTEDDLITVNPSPDTTVVAVRNKYDPGSKFRIVIRQTKAGDWLYSLPRGNDTYHFDTRAEAVEEARRALLNIAKKAITTQPTRHGAYQEPGGTRYREIRLTVPTTNREGDNTYVVSGHYNEPGVVVALRVNDRPSSLGKKTLHVEEIQSDAGVAASRYGYNKLTAAEREEIEALERAHSDYLEELRANTPRGQEFSLDNLEPHQREHKRKLWQKWRDAIDKAGGIKSIDGAYPAPFIGDTSAYVDLALKRLLTIAAQEGYDGITLSKGQHQSRRWDLSKHVDELRYDGEKLLGIRDGRWVFSQKMGEDQIADYVGKGPAQKLLAAQPTVSKRQVLNADTDEYFDVDVNTRVIKGDDLRVGDLWAFDFYDKLIPSRLEKLLKKFGLKTQKATSSFGTEFYEVARQRNGDFGVYDGDGDLMERFDTRESAERALKDLKARQGHTDDYGDVIGVKLTPEIREAIASEGFPQYALDSRIDEFREQFNPRSDEDVEGEVDGPTLAQAARKIANDRPYRSKAQGPVLISGGSASKNKIPTANPDEPSFTVLAKPNPIRVLMPDGSVFRLVGRAIARLMGVPDSFPLTGNEALDHTMLGNGVPPPLMAAVVEPMLETIKTEKGKKPKGVSLFSGAGIAEAILKRSVDFIGAVEYVKEIADHYRKAHGDHVVNADVQTVDYAQWAGADYLHASPVCKNFSGAKAQAGEVELDITTAKATARAIEEIGPQVVTVENVADYRDSEAMKIIEKALKENGYTYDVNVFDAADYGVPQHRERLILRATKSDKLPPLPAKQKHVGWWDAVKDLAMGRDRGLAPWQKERLAKKGVIEIEGEPGPAQGALFGPTDTTPRISEELRPTPTEGIQQTDKAYVGRGAVAPKSYSVAAAESIEKAAANVQSEEGPKVLMSAATSALTNKAAQKYNKKKGVFSPEKLKQFTDSISNVAAIVMSDIERLGYTAIRGVKSLKPNSDPQYKLSEDYTTLCVRRMRLADTLDAIQERLSRLMTPEQWLEVTAALERDGFEVSCGPCYVESRRRNMKTAIDKAVNGWERSGKWLQLDPQYREKAYTQEGRDWLYENAIDQYKIIAKAFSGLQAKIPMGRSEYHGEVLKLNQKQVDRFNRFSGIRSQSWSDFEIPHLIDKMQSTLDKALRGLMGHSYTKESNYVKLMKDTGEMINMSLVPLGMGLDKNGKLVWNTKQSIRDIEEMKALREEYDNLGFEGIGVSDEHIRAMLDSDEIDYIIPFHASGTNKAHAAKLGMEGWTDYGQAKDNEFGGRSADQEWVDTKTGEPVHDPDRKVFINEWKGDYKKLWALCKERGVRPPFPQFKDHPRYYRLLTDRRVMNAEGKYIEQQPLQFSFDMKLVQKMLDDYRGGHRSGQPIDSIVEEFVEKFGGSAKVLRQNMEGRFKDVKGTRRMPLPAGPTRTDQAARIAGGMKFDAEQAEAKKSKEEYPAQGMGLAKNLLSRIKDNYKAIRQAIDDVEESGRVRSAEEIRKLAKEDPVGYALDAATNYLLDNMQRISDKTEIGAHFSDRTPAEEIYKGGYVNTQKQTTDWNALRAPIWLGKDLPASQRRFNAGQLWVQRANLVLETVLNNPGMTTEYAVGIMAAMAKGNEKVLDMVLPLYIRQIQDTLGHEILHGYRDTVDTTPAMQKKMNESGRALLDMKLPDGTTLREGLAQYFDTESMKAHIRKELQKQSAIAMQMHLGEKATAEWGVTLKQEGSKLVADPGANDESFAEGIKSLAHGKDTQEAKYVHRAGLKGPMAELANRVAKEHGIDSGKDVYNIVKFNKGKRRITFLSYPGFYTDPHPALAKSVLVDLSTGKVSRVDYTGRDNQLILHRKEQFIPTSDPMYQKFAALSEQEKKAGILGSNKIGYKKGWDELLKEKGLSIEGHSLKGVQEAPVGYKGKEKWSEEEVASNAGSTSIKRGASSHAKKIIDMLRGKSVIDWGQGKYADDVKFFKENGIESVRGYDPNFQPEIPSGMADIVTNTFVGNVLPPNMRRRMWQDAMGHAKEKLLIAVRADPPSNPDNYEKYADGLLMGNTPTDGSLGRRTFQKFFTQSSLIEELKSIFPPPTYDVVPGPIKSGSATTAIVIRKNADKLFEGKGVRSYMTGWKPSARRDKSQIKPMFGDTGILDQMKAEAEKSLLRGEGARGATNPKDLVRKIKAVLTPDLLTPKWRKKVDEGDDAATGHCYAASEAAYHMLGGKAAGYSARVANLGNGETHWWIVGPGGIVDPTASQFSDQELLKAYRIGKPIGFLTKEPSKRAAEIIKRVAKKEQ